MNMRDETILEQLIEDIFVKSFRRVSFGERYWDISPFNVEHVRKELDPLIEKEYRERVPHPEDVLVSLDDISAAIKRDGGITQGTYNAHHFALNGIARTLTGTNTRISGGLYSLEEDDQRSREIGCAHSSLADGEYGEMTRYFNDINIFGNNGEGTLFQRKYDDGDFLTTFRIFHQFHRASLKVATVDLTKLQERVNELIKERDVGRRVVDLSLPYDAETFVYEKIVKFNELFGDSIRLNVFSVSGYSPNPLFVVEFKEHHLAVAERLIDLQWEHGISLTTFKRDEWTTLRKEGDYRPLDFGDRKVIDSCYSENLRLDKTSDAVQSYLIIGNSIPEFFPPMIKSYILSRS